MRRDQSVRCERSAHGHNLHFTCQKAGTEPGHPHNREGSMADIRHICAAALLMPVLAAPAHAQVSQLPMDIQQVLATLGPKWGTALRENIEATAAAFRPLLKAAPRDGVKVARNLAYGEDARQVLDVYQPIWRGRAPGGGFLPAGAHVCGGQGFLGGMD